MKSLIHSSLTLARASIDDLLASEQTLLMIDHIVRLFVETFQNNCAASMRIVPFARKSYFHIHDRK